MKTNWDQTIAKDKNNEIEYVTKEEFDIKTKELERKIAILEARLNNVVSGWDEK